MAEAGTTEKVSVVTRGFPGSPSINALARRGAEKVMRKFDGIESCNVTISLQHRRKRHGKVFHVTVNLGLPWGTVMVSREPERDPAHENAGLAIRDAFLAARRRVEDEVRIRRGFVKHHDAEAPLAPVALAS